MNADAEIVYLHDSLDATVSRLRELTAAKGRPVTCRGLGCCACCYEPVQVERREVEHALAGLGPVVREQVRRQTRLWVERVLPTGLLMEALPNAFAWRAARATCPFLSLDGQACSVYDYRPGPCRIHLAVGPPEKCLDDHQRPHQTYVSAKELAEGYMAARVRLGGPIEIDHLGVILADLLLGIRIPTADHAYHSADQVARAAELL